MDKLPALVLDGHVQSALAIVRSLGEQGIVVHVAATRRTAMSLHSRYAKQTHVYPDPLKDRQAFIVWLKEVAETHGPLVVFPCSDRTLSPVLEILRTQTNGKLLYACPDLASTDAVEDKKKTYEIARELGVPVPASVSTESPTIPFVIKPRRSCVWRNNVGQHATASIIRSTEDWQVFLAKKPNLEDWVMQAFLTGDEYGYFAFAIDGEVRYEYAHHRLQSLNWFGGASTGRESIAMPDDMREQSRALIQRLKWTGPCMVEYKRSSVDGKAYLMEINGRVWGSLPLSIALGFDFPGDMYRLADGQTVPTRPSTYPVGTKALHLWPLLFSVVKHPSHWKRVKRLWRGSKPVYDVERWSDPWPSFWEAIDGLRSRLG